MKDGFLKAAALSPALRVADCGYNTDQILTQLRDCAQRGVKLAVFPEFCLTGYTCGDLFLQRTLQQGALEGLGRILEASAGLDLVALVGLPLMVRGKLYNCAAVVCRGQILGVVPKTYLPNYGEFYEKRQFTPGSCEVEQITLCGQEVPFGTSLLFRCRQLESFVLGVELCEDLWSALPPSTFHALAGATVIANLSASDETVGKAAYRRSLVTGQSGRLVCGYVYADAGEGESTTDLVFSGHNLIAENGTLLAERRFGTGLTISQLDIGRLCHERQRLTTFRSRHPEGWAEVRFTLSETRLTRPISPTPFVPQDEAGRAERCQEILTLAALGLAKRLEHTGAKTAVVGLSGGLDSTLAFLVALQAMEQLGRANMVVVGARDLVPGASVRLHGIKTFEKERIDLAILYAASVLIAGCVMLLAQARTAKGFGKVTAIIGAVYNGVTGYFGDILSYSRLMVMMLAGSVIGQVFNILAAMPGSGLPPALGIPIFFIIFLLGHSFNIGLNVIGTYVHTSRLQYLEFFKQFYQEGGRPWRPLEINTKYVDIEEEK